MASFNKVVLLGNVTRDPELRYISSGTAVTEIGLAVNDRRKTLDIRLGHHLTTARVGDDLILEVVSSDLKRLDCLVDVLNSLFDF